MNELLFNLIQAVVIFILGVIVRYLVPLAKEKVANTKYEAVFEWAYKFVCAAEQTITGGVDKKEYVVNKLNELLSQKKLNLTDEQIDALIEASVNELFPKRISN